MEYKNEPGKVKVIKINKMERFSETGTIDMVKFILTHLNIPEDPSNMK